MNEQPKSSEAEVTQPGNSSKPPVLGLDAKSWLESLKLGTGAITDLSKSAIQQLRGVFALWAAVLGIAAIVVLILAAMLIFKDHYNWGGWLVVALLLLIAAAILVPVWRLGATLLYELPRHSGTPGAARESLQRPGPSWFRLVPNVALTEEQRRAVQELLKEIHREALHVIRNTLGCKVDSDAMVRGNIFVPDITALSTGKLCELYIPEGYSIGMEAPETQLRFWPNQGLTGVVFASQNGDAACSKAAPAGRVWDSRYNLTDWQKQIIHKDLRWIASLPVKVGDGRDARAVAVLNIDGVGFDLEPIQLEALIGRLIGYAGALAGRFKEFGCQRLAIYLEENTK